MLYNKPKDVRYVDMCIWCDNHMYDEDVDDNKLFEYLWHISYMLAIKKKFFHKAQYYDDFATYMATELFFRIKNKKQFEDPPKMLKIKSILNFSKAVLYPNKVDFEQKFYSQILSPKTEESLEDVEYDINYSFKDIISESVDEMSRVEFDACLHDICKTIKNYLKRIPYYSNKKEWYNIYISCLLTFLDGITIDKRNDQRIKSFVYKDYIDSKHEIWQERLNDNVILFHLPESMENYIKVLVKELRHVVANDLSSYLHTYIPSGSNYTYIALADINNLSADSGDNQYDEN